MFRFALRNMAVKWGKLMLVALSIVITASVAVLSYNVSMQVREGIVNTAAYYDIIIGPSGSSTQLAMNTMFFTDTPLGTIPYSLVEELEGNPNVNAVVPFTMGDSYNSARIVGTTGAYLDGKPLKEGEMFQEQFEAVIGAGVAKAYSLSVGDPIVTSHGLSEHGEAGSEHTASPLTVVGILGETHTAYDNTVFTSFRTVWAIHGLVEAHEEEERSEEEHSEEEHSEEEHSEEEHEHAGEGSVCAILVKTKDFNSYYAISNYYSQDSSLLVINPSTVLREVLGNVDLSSQIVYALCAVILVMNLFVISVITLLNLYDAKKEIALMRLIGIGMGRIGCMYLIQNAITGIISTSLALAASRLFLKAMGSFVASRGIVLNELAVYPLELAILAGVFLISVLPTCFSVWRMSRRDGLGG